MPMHFLQPGYMHDQPVETMPRARIRREQGQKLKEVAVRVSQSVPHYAAAFRAAGVGPDDIQSADDVRHLPFTTKDDLRDAYPCGMLGREKSDVVRLHASSGTSGASTITPYTQDDIVTWTDLVARSLACAGVRRGDVIHNAHGYGLFTGGLGVHYGAESLDCAVVPASGGGTARQARLIRDLEAGVLCATPSYALHLAETAEADGVDLASAPLAIGVFGGEPWSETFRAELDRRLGIKAVDLYGLSEVMGPGVAVECVECRDGLHAWEDHFLFEIVSPETGEPLPMGETGELVITTLTKQAQPLIRYRTGDITSMDDSLCPCGRTHARLMRIAGRADDMLIVRGVNVYPSQVESFLAGRDGITPNYRLVVEREGALDSLTVEVEAEREGGDFHALAADLEKWLKSQLGVAIRCKILFPGAIPRSEGKAERVWDLREAK